ncbi:MAG TPA: hypothetical protein DCE07_03845 [Peptococcaceae bacterium]|nr:hypothetical protein [Peptococcaceae bacterium]
MIERKKGHPKKANMVKITPALAEQTDCSRFRNLRKIYEGQLRLALWFCPTGLIISCVAIDDFAD